MSYRNITVNETVYKYVIGRKFTKVNGVGVIPNHDLGNPVGSRISYRTGKVIPWEEFKDPSRRFLVTPADVRRMILGNGKVDPNYYDKPHTCGCGKTGYDVFLGVWPYDCEIYGKKHYSYMCEDCCERNAGDI